PVASSEVTSRLPAASRYQVPASDFHSTPASTCGARAPHAGTSSAFAATAPTGPPGVRNCASTRAPSPRQVSARVHTHAAVPAVPSGTTAVPTPAAPAPGDPGSGCSANAHALTLRTPADRIAVSEQAYGAQVRNASAPDASRRAPGRPAVRFAGTTSPRSVTSRVPVPSVSWSTFHDVHAPGRRAGLASGEVTPSVRVRSIVPASGSRRSRSPAERTHGAVR